MALIQKDMETKVYSVSKEISLTILSDEIVKRKGEAKSYDPSMFDLKLEGKIIVVKGDKEFFSLEILKGLEEVKDTTKIFEKIEEQNENSASGVGMLFG